MAGSGAIENRLARLTAARELAKEAGGKRIINARQLGEMLGVSSRQAVNLLNAVFTSGKADKIIRRWGGNGVDFEIDEARVVEVLIADCDKRLGEREERVAVLASYGGIETVNTTGAKLTISELREVQRIQRENQKHKLDQGHYVLAELHRRIVSDLFLKVQSDYGSVSTELDADGLWSEEFRAEVDEYFRNRSVELHDEFERYLTDNGAEAGADRS